MDGVILGVSILLGIVFILMIFIVFLGGRLRNKNNPYFIATENFPRPNGIPKETPPKPIICPVNGNLNSCRITNINGTSYPVYNFPLSALGLNDIPYFLNTDGVSFTTSSNPVNIWSYTGSNILFGTSALYSPDGVSVSIAPLKYTKEFDFLYDGYNFYWIPSITSNSVKFINFVTTVPGEVRLFLTETSLGSIGSPMSIQPLVRVIPS